MKSSLLLTLFALTAVAYGGIVAPATPVQEPVLSKESEAEVLDRAGKTLETVGRILQGKDADSTKEQQQDILEVLRALTAGEKTVGDDDAEYIWPIIVRGAVAHGVKKWLDKRG
uniref:Putative secreted protein n=1 Tax=Amblyomma cajennense TaxID=34607 RepID=A0A023FEX3_AMBCJ